MPVAGYVKPLEVAAGKRPDSVPLRVWRAPERIAEVATGLKLGRDGIAEKACVDPGTVSKWLNRKSVPEAAALARFEDNCGLPAGYLTASSEDSGNKPATINVLDTAAALGLHESVISELLGASVAERMRELPEELKRAVLGAVHLLGYPLETAVKAAHIVRDGKPGQSMLAESWLVEMRAVLAQFGKPGSGTFPSSSKIKLG